jgi:hypothetical protein
MFNELGFGTSGHRRPELGRLAGHTALLRRMPQASLEAIIVVAGRKDRSACIVSMPVSSSHDRKRSW